MGWFYLHKPKYQKVRDFFREQWTCENDDMSWKVLDVAFQAFSSERAVYAAIECLNKKTGERRVEMEVALISFEPHSECNLGYKTVGYYGPRECPKRLLELLTPTDDEDALKWRKEAWERLTRTKEKSMRFSAGMLIQTKKAISWSNGDTCCVYEVSCARGKRVLLRGYSECRRYAGRYRISRDSLLAHDVVRVDPPMVSLLTYNVKEGDELVCLDPVWEKDGEVEYRKPRYLILDAQKVVRARVNVDQLRPKGVELCKELPLWNKAVYDKFLEREKLSSLAGNLFLEAA